LHQTKLNKAELAQNEFFKFQFFMLADATLPSLKINIMYVCSGRFETLPPGEHILLTIGGN
jgi:hypothetical protein